MAASRARRASWFRPVRHYPSQTSDFLSEQGAGRPPFADDPDATRLWSGVSVWAAERQATSRARAFLAERPFIVRLEVSEDAFAVLRTTVASGHHTVVGEPQAIFLRSVRNRPATDAVGVEDGSHLEIWSNTTGNLVAAFPNRRDALAALRRARQTNGDAYVTSLSLLEFHDAEAPSVEQGRHLLRYGKAGTVGYSS